MVAPCLPWLHLLSSETRNCLQCIPRTSWTFCVFFLLFFPTDVWVVKIPCYYQVVWFLFLKNASSTFWFVALGPYHYVTPVFLPLLSSARDFQLDCLSPSSGPQIDLSLMKRSLKLKWENKETKPFQTPNSTVFLEVMYLCMSIALLPAIEVMLSTLMLKM